MTSNKKTKLDLNYSNMTVKQLKIQLKKYGLSQGGKKADLYQRLTDHIAIIQKECESAGGRNNFRQKREQSAAILRATIVAQSTREGYKDALDPDQLKLIAEDPLVCTFATEDAASPLVTACAYGKIDIVRKMLSAGADVNNKSVDQRSPLTWAVLLDCDDERVLGQECGDECNLHCVYDDGGCILANHINEKLAIVKMLGPQCNKIIIQDALTAAKVQLKSFQDNLRYHEEDALEGGPECDVEHAEDRVLECTNFVSALTEVLEKKVQSTRIAFRPTY